MWNELQPGSRWDLQGIARSDWEHPVQGIEGHMKLSQLLPVQVMPDMEAQHRIDRFARSEGVLGVVNRLHASIYGDQK